MNFWRIKEKKSRLNIEHNLQRSTSSPSRRSLCAILDSIPVCVSKEKRLQLSWPGFASWPQIVSSATQRQNLSETDSSAAIGTIDSNEASLLHQSSHSTERLNYHCCTNWPNRMWNFYGCQWKYTGSRPPGAPLARS